MTLIKKLAVIAVLSLSLSACATTAQVEKAQSTADIAFAQSTMALYQNEAIAVEVANLNEKLERMYKKLMTK